jgi:hypothetical protein
MRLLIGDLGSLRGQLSNALSSMRFTLNPLQKNRMEHGRLIFLVSAPEDFALGESISQLIIPWLKAAKVSWLSIPKSQTYRNSQCSINSTALWDLSLVYVISGTISLFKILGHYSSWILRGSFGQKYVPNNEEECPSPNTLLRFPSPVCAMYSGYEFRASGLGSGRCYGLGV